MHRLEATFFYFPVGRGKNRLWFRNPKNSYHTIFFFCWSNSANAFCQIWQINIVAAFPAIAKLAPLRIFSIESKNLSFCSILLITLEMQKTRQLSLCNTLHNTIIYPYLLSLSSSKKNMNINLRQKNVFRLYSLCWVDPVSSLFIKMFYFFTRFSSAAVQR